MLSNSSGWSLPLGGQEIGQLLVGRCGQAGKYVFQIFPRVYAVALAADQDRVNDRTAPARFRVPDEQPVFLAHRRWPDRVFGQVVVDFQTSIGQVSLQRLPLAQHIAHRLAQWTLWQQRRRHGLQAFVQSFPDRWCYLVAQLMTLFGTQTLFTSVRLDEVEFMQFLDKPGFLLRTALHRFDKLPAHVGQAGTGD